MKTLLRVIFLTGLLLSLRVGADDPNYDTSTRIINFPRVTIDFEDAFINTKLRLNQDGSWELLAIEPDVEPEPTPEPKLNLTGDWNGNGGGEIFASFLPGIPCHGKWEASFTQNGNQITGSWVFIEGCHEGESGNITGMINGNDISFKVNLGDTMIINYTGTISSDFRTLEGEYSSVYFDEFGVWKLSFQK